MNRSDLLTLKKFAAPGFLQATHRFSFAMHRTKSRFSKQQTCRLLSQIERFAAYASGSGVEAWNRRSTNDILRHLSFANGSSDELCFFLILTTVLEYGSQREIAEPDSGADWKVAMTAALNRPPKESQEA